MQDERTGPGIGIAFTLGRRTFLVHEERADQEYHLVGVERRFDEGLVVVAAILEGFAQVGRVSLVKLLAGLTDGDRGEAVSVNAKLLCQSLVGVGVDGKAALRIVVMDDDAMILHENDGGNLTSLFPDAAKLVADGKGQICAGIGVGDPAPGVVRAVERLFRDLAAGGRAGGEICGDAVGVADKGLENGVEAGLDGGAQCVHALDELRVFLCAGGAELFNVGQLRRLVAVVEAAERFIVEHGVGLVRTDIRQAVAGGLDGHKTVGQLDGGVAAAALHIVGACARSL